MPDNRLEQDGLYGRINSLEEEIADLKYTNQKLYKDCVTFAKKLKKIQVSGILDEDVDGLKELNTQYAEEIAALKEQLVDYEEAVNQNKFYEDYLDIKEANEDFKFCPALITSTDPDDDFGGFTVDAGTLSGVKLYDPVITDKGLVGYVTEVGATTSKVTTILSPSLTCGAYDSRTSDSGAVSGSYELAVKGQTRFYNLPRTCSVAIGDLIVTSGSGLFPDKIIIGSVSNISSDPLSSSLYATVTPTVDFGSLKMVMIVTEFAGQGNALTGE